MYIFNVLKMRPTVSLCNYLGFWEGALKSCTRKRIGAKIFVSRWARVGCGRCLATLVLCFLAEESMWLNILLPELAAIRMPEERVAGYLDSRRSFFAWETLKCMTER